jgi:hypothetical protein
VLRAVCEAMTQQEIVITIYIVLSTCLEQNEEQSAVILQLESQSVHQQQQQQQQQQQRQKDVLSSDQRDASPTIASGTNTGSSTVRYSLSSNTNRYGTAVRQCTALQERSANTTATGAESSTDTSNNQSDSRPDVDADRRHKQSQRR